MPPSRLAPLIWAFLAPFCRVLDHRLSFWDAMLWATVQQAGCALLLSEDFQDGRQLGAVTFVNPFAPANQALLDRELPAPIA